MLLAALLALLPAAVEPATLPAQGRQAALLTVERTGMVRLQAKGGGGTACTLVDQLRGPFASSGAAGREDCALDVLLDAGRYKVRLESPARLKAPATVALTAVPFEEVDPAPVGLAPGQPVERRLPEGRQASFWFRVKERGPVAVRVAGRTAGAVHLWRGGEWRVELSPLHQAAEPGAGQPIHEWWVQAVLEPGDYRLTAYGTGALRFTRGEETDLVTAELGFATRAERTLRATLGPSAAVVVATDKAPLTALLSVENPGAGRVRLSVHPLGDDGARLGQEEANCLVEPKSPAAECAVRVGDGRHVLAVHGPAGAQVVIRWAPRRGGAGYVDGEYGDLVYRLPLDPVSSGEYLLGLHDVPADRDAAPLGCALERQAARAQTTATRVYDGPRELVAWDAPKVGGGKGLRRAFNYARYETLWFDVATAGELTVAVEGARGEDCELGRVLADSVERLAEGGPSTEGGKKGCRFTRRFAAGLHQLKLSGGTEGIESVRIAPPGVEPAESPPRDGCTLRARLDIGYRYAVVASRLGRVAVRGLVARPLPLTLDAPVPVEVQAGETVTLPIAVAGTYRAATPAGAPAGCHLTRGGAGQWRDGACWIEAKGPDELVLTAGPAAPLLAWIGRAEPPRPPSPPLAFDPARADLPLLAPGEGSRFDFEPGQERSLLFDVTEAGLHDVGTEGLLSTTCAIRTAALAGLAADGGGGRGRNCLVSAFLRPGRYLVTVRTEAPSRGRAGVVLTRRPARDLPPLDGESERFFRAAAGELVRQAVAIPKAGRWNLSATALGAKLACRLEDQDGWPLVPVPGPCRVSEELPEGRVLWTGLPLTVESMRRTAAAPERPAEVLRGETTVHPLALWRPYDAELGKDGQDEFRFTVPAEGDVAILLTNGMLGRVYREGEPQPVELVPPDERSAVAAEPAGEPEATPDGADAGDVEAPMDHDGEATPDGDAPPEPEAPPPPRRRTPVPPAPPRPVERAPGVRLHLAAGAYRLVTQHARGDVAIAYRVQVSVEPLMPGVERDLPVPSRVPLRVAAAGTLRLRTAGEADVRCRLFDASGRLLATSSEVGEDWNCGLAEPVAAGDYLLEIESEMVVPGATRLTVAEPAPADVGALADGKRYPLDAGVLSAALPPPPGDAVLEVSLEGAAPFSCAVDDSAGRLAWRSTTGTGCSAMLLPGGLPWRLRAWTLDRPTEVTARVRVRPVVPFTGGKLPDGGAGRARVERPGTYRTAEGVRCLAGSAGLLEPCGPEVSLEPGTVVLAGPSGRSAALDEVVEPIAAGSEQAIAVTPRPRLVRASSSQAAAHLVAVTVAPGERTVPACRLDGGVHVPSAGGCFAAAGPGQTSLLRLTAAAPVEARLWRAAVTGPKEGALPAGRSALEVAPSGALLALPSGPVRVELTLPPRAWAVLLQGGQAADLCPPAAALARCVLTGASGARLVLLAPGERRVEATVTTLPAPGPARDLAGLVEEVAPLPATRTWRLPAAGVERVLRVEGATACTVALDNGARLSSCETAIPAGAAGTVVVEHRAGPVRLLAAPRDDRLALAGSGGGGGARRLDPGEAVALEGALVERTLDLPAEAVVHLRADRGVCALVSNGQAVATAGLGEGCRIDRLLGRGSHRLVVRGFGGAPLAGTASYTVEPVEPLGEGVGAERWLAPGDARLFRFTLATQGRVGLGLREEAEALECAVTDEAARPLGDGCQQLLSLPAGTYLLAVRAPPGVPASRFRPVLLGLAGSETGVPAEYLRDFFQRIGGTK